VIADEAELRAWMLAGLAGDAAAYRRLLSALSGHLRAYYRRRIGDEAEDLVQETLIAMHAKRATYDPAQPLTAWVYAIARYKLIDAFRRGKTRKWVSLDDAAELFARDESETAAARRDVEKLLARLPRARRELVRDVKIDGLSTAEAAARHGLSESAVKVGVHRALKALGLQVGAEREDG
jgi:RNA polymerase sigma-70 factor (ECF subfamily)